MDGQAIKDQIALLEEKEQELLSEDKLDTDALNATRNKLMELKYELSQQEERTQKQEAVIAEQLVLPRDYDERTGLPGMNDEFLALIRQALEQVTAIHNAEMLEVQAEKAALKVQVDNLTEKNVEQAQRINNLEPQVDDLYNKISAAVTAKEEAEAVAEKAKRDAEEQKANDAVEIEKAKREAESLKKQVDELERMVIQQKKPSAPVGGITFTSTLPDETPDEKAARLKRIELERMNRNLEKYNVAPLPVLNLPETPQPEVTSKQLDEAFPTGGSQPAVAQGDTGVDGVSQVAEAVAEAGHAEATAVTLEALDARVKDLEARMDRLTAPTANVA